jgi:HSP20 family molecular chaperone IbpA
MNARKQLAGRDAEVRRYEYDDSVLVVADFGDVGSASVDVVGDTAIVVVDGEEFDVELADDAQAFMKNGVLTIEVSA